MIYQRYCKVMEKVGETDGKTMIGLEVNGLVVWKANAQRIKDNTHHTHTIVVIRTRLSFLHEINICLFVCLFIRLADVSKD